MIDYNCWHQVQQQETVAELKVALEEAVLGHTLVHQELELLRSSSSDVEFVEHIKALEEQLSLKTAEVTKQRFASTQVTANMEYIINPSFRNRALMIFNMIYDEDISFYLGARATHAAAGSGGESRSKHPRA